MAEVINLRAKRKDRVRRAARAAGDENAMKSGRTKAQRLLEDAEGAKARAELDGKKTDNPNSA